MIRTNPDRPIYASDSYAWDRCPRLVWFLFHPPAAAELAPDPFDTLIKQYGDEHEAGILASMVDSIISKSMDHTVALIADEAPVIYQARLEDKARNIIGVPDFLLRTEIGYQVADAKLALSVEKNRAILAQLGVYQYLLTQVCEPNEEELRPIVFLGDGEAFEVDVDVLSVAEKFLSTVENIRDQDNMPDTHFAHSKCAPCDFFDYCHDWFVEQDDMTLSPAVDSRTAQQLRLQNINTLTQLANIDAEGIDEAPYLRNPDKRLRIVQQAQSLVTGEVIIRQAPQWPRGTLIHFDIESDPLGGEGDGEVYLWGLLKPGSSDDEFEYIWRETDDFASWQAFLNLVRDYRQRWPDLRLVHYSPFERVQIKRYVDRYAASDDPIAQWLLDTDGPLWDLQAFVKLYFVLPVESYGLKTICRDERLVNFQWRLEESGSQWSVVQYHQFVAALASSHTQQARSIRDEILTYNEDDVRATAAMVDWLKSISVGMRRA
ncbi:MAG: TM0106 family RecB-like putative nuclease [Pseudomonadota bacterium]